MKTQHDEEVDKTESKQIHDDVSNAAQQLPVSNIKQEPGLNDPEEHIGKKHAFKKYDQFALNTILAAFGEALDQILP